MIIKSYAETSEMLMEGKIGLVPTDTLYGISCLALNSQSVERIYGLKERDKNKPFIVLISDVDDLTKLKIQTDEKIINVLNGIWPAPVSVILPCPDESMGFLHRGSKSLAIRAPDVLELREMLKKTGPIVSTTANTQGNSPAVTVEEAIEMFGEKLDFYLDVGPLNNPPSRIIKYENQDFTVIR